MARELASGYAVYFKLLAKAPAVNEAAQECHDIQDIKFLVHHTYLLLPTYLSA
jgi:hypothetical protein